MRLDVMAFPKIADGGLADALTGRHEAATPVRLALRLRLQGRINNRLDPLRTIGRFASAPRSDLPQTLQSLLRKALSPQADRLAINPQFRPNRCFGFALRRSQHNAASQRDLL